MKRHISIFAFLLGAFAASGLAPSASAGTQNVSGGHYYFDGSWTGADVKYMSTTNRLNGSLTTTVQNVEDGTGVEFTAHPDPGMNAASWKALFGQSAQVGIMQIKDWPTGLATTNYTLNADSSKGSVAYLAVNFTYIPLVVKTNTVTITNGTINTTGIKLPSSSKIGHTGKWKNEKGDTFKFGAEVSGADFWYGADGDPNRGFYANLTEDWTPNTYTIAFDGNDADGSMEPMSCTYDVSTNLTKNTFERTHYAFAGWNTKDDGTGDDYSNGASVKNLTAENGGTVTLYAQWTLNRYTVKTQVADGSKDKGETAPASMTQDADTTLTITAKPKDGYAFAQWNDGSAVASRTIQVVSNATYEATFTNRVFTMTFDPNGDGATCGETSRQIAYLSPIGLDATGQPKPLPEATRYNHTFLGWYTHKTAGEQITENTAEHGTKLYDWITDITLYAHWTEVKAHSITVTCEPAKGGSATITGESVGGKFVDGKEIILTATPSNGYSFARWERGSNAYTDNPLKSKATESADYIAVFTGKVYQVNFFAMEGHFEGGATLTSASYSYGEPFGSFPACTREGWDLKGWFTQPIEGFGKRVDVTDKLEQENLILYAIWTLKPTYTIAFDGNGATNETTMADQKAYCGEDVVLASNQYARAGYTFEHWTNSVGKVYLDGETVHDDLANTNETARLYAVWSPIHYTLAFDPQGGDFGSEVVPMDCIYGQEYELQYKNGTRELFAFAGWSNVWNGAVYSAANGFKAKDAYDVPNGTNTLIALWDSQLTDYSLAMHCTNLVWTSENKTCWECIYGLPTPPNPSDSCVRGKWGQNANLSASVSGPGTLGFMWKSDTAENWAVMKLMQGQNAETLITNLVAKTTDWCYTEVHLADATKVTFYFTDGGYSFDIDQMTWTPKPLHPVPDPDEDFVTISSAAVSDGKFVLSFKSDEKFDYNLLTNANLLINEGWGVMGEKKIGNGNILTFKPEIIEGQPQMFYRVDTIQRK